MTERPRKRAESFKELRALFLRESDPKGRERSIAAYKPQPTDIVITPFGKSGTTWTQQIFHTLRTRGDMAFDDISRVVPWIETADRLNLDINADQRAEPRGFKSHLDYDAMPKGAKYINVIRHPVDAAFSSFKFMEGWYFEPGSIKANEFVQLSTADAGYHKHFTGWWQHRNDANVLYLVYEHMKQDLEGTIEKIASFCHIELDDELLDITLEHASLPFMLNYKDRFDDAMLRELSEKTLLPSGSDSAKVREGKVGVNDLSKETIEMLEKLWRDNLASVTGFETYESLIASLK